MIMKKIFCFLAASLLVLASCQKEKLDGAAPVVAFDQESVEAIIDADLTISGVITAENGIAEFSIVNEAYGIDRHESYSARYQPAEFSFQTDFSVPAGLKTDQQIVVTVKDAAGLTCNASIDVKFLVDSTNPTVELASSALIFPDATSGKVDYSLAATISDNQELDCITIECAALNLNHRETLYGSSADYAYTIEGITDGEYSIDVKVYDKTGNHTDNTVALKAVTDSEDPVLTLESGNPVSEILGDGETYTYKFKATVSDNFQLGALKLMLITPDWATTYETYDVDLSGKASETVEHDFVISSRGSYQIYYYLSDISTSVQSWGNDIDGYIDITLSSADSDAPFAECLSPLCVAFGSSYTLDLKFTDESGIDENAWPKITVYNENGTQPTEIVDNWGGWWPSLTGTECTVSQPLTFTEAGTYKVWIDPLKDLVGNTSDGAEWFEIYVLESPDVVGPKVRMNNPAKGKVGETLTLSLTVGDVTGIDVNVWPKVTVYNENGTEPTEIKDNWDGWWPTLEGTDCTVTFNLTFTEAGTYKVWIDALKDTLGNETPEAEWFTITVN